MNPTELVERVLALAGGESAVGVDVLHAEPGCVHLSIARRPDLLQFRGYFHGGVISSLADLAGGGAITTSLPAGRAVVTITLNVNFLSGASGERLLARGQAIKVGSTVGVAAVDIVTTSGGEEKLCATATITYRIVVLD